MYNTVVKALSNVPLTIVYKSVLLSYVPPSSGVKNRRKKSLGKGIADVEAGGAAV